MFALCVRDGSVSDEQLGEVMAGDNLGTTTRRRSTSAADAANEAFAIPGAMDRMVKLPFGEMPAGMAVNIAIFDVATHAWDLAKATGQSTELDPEVVRRRLPGRAGHAERRPAQRGMFGPAVAVADDAPVADRLAALAGRTPDTRVSRSACRRAARTRVPSASATGGVGDRAVDGVHAQRRARGRSATASRTPRVASATAYGSVALVSAYVDVCGTAAGMLPTA